MQETRDYDAVVLYEFQVAVLDLSEKDLIENKVIPQDELDAFDLDWLKNLTNDIKQK